MPKRKTYMSEYTAYMREMSVSKKAKPKRVVAPREYRIKENPYSNKVLYDSNPVTMSKGVFFGKDSIFFCRFYLPQN